MGTRRMKIQRRLNPVLDPVWAYVEIPPASLSATMVMTPGPSAASNSTVRLRHRLTWWMVLLIQNMARYCDNGPARGQAEKSLEVIPEPGSSRDRGFGMASICPAGP